VDSLISTIGVTCLAINSGENNTIEGRTRLQKMIYFSKYLGWDVGEYKLHYYGPFSFSLADTVKTAKNNKIINEDSPKIGPYSYTLTEPGNRFLKTFVDEICDQKKIERTKGLFEYLSSWSKEQLELAATIDYVEKNNPGITKTNLITKVSTIKENFSDSSIQNAYNKWIDLKKMIKSLQK